MMSVEYVMATKHGGCFLISAIKNKKTKKWNLCVENEFSKSICISLDFDFQEEVFVFVLERFGDDFVCSL